MESLKAHRGLKWTNIQNIVLLLFVPLLCAMLLMLACSPYTSQPKVTPMPTTKQCYLVLPPDVVKYLFSCELFAITPDEYISWVMRILNSCTVNDMGQGEWLIHASYGNTMGVWTLGQDPVTGLTFYLDSGAWYIEESVLRPLWERPNVWTFDGPYGVTENTHYTTLMRPIEAYSAVLRAVTAKVNGDPQAAYLQGRADALSGDGGLKYEVHVEQ